MIPRRLYLKNSVGLLKGIGKGEVDIDFTKFRPGLVGIFGQTGSGKTTIMENMIPYRQLITRSGSLYDHFRGNGVRIFEFQQDDNIYESKILIDCDKRKMVATMSRDGVVLNDKTEAYDACVRELMGDINLYINSVFSPQSYEHIITSKDIQLKQLFMMLFNLNKYEKEYIPVVKLKLNDLEKQIQSSKVLYDQLNRDIEDLGEIKKNLKILVSNIPTLEKNAEAANEELKSHNEKISLLLQNLTEAKMNLQSLSGLEKNIKTLTEEIEEIASSGAKEARDIESQAKNNEKDYEMSVAEVEEIKNSLIRAEKILLNEKLIIEKNNEIKTNRDLLDKIVAYEKILSAQREKIREKEKSLDKIQSEIDSISKQTEYLKSNSDILDGGVPCSDTKELYSVCPLLDNARKSKSGIDDLNKKISVLNKQAEELSKQISDEKTINQSTNPVYEDYNVVNKKISDLLKDKWDELFVELNAVKNKIESWRKSKSNSEERINTCNIIREELNKKLSTIEERIEDKVNKKKQALSVIQKEYDTKKASINIDDILKNIERHEYLLIKIESNSFSANHELSATKARIEEYEKQLVLLERKETSAKNKIKEINESINDIEEYKVIEKALKSIPIYELESLSVLTTDYTNSLLSLYSDSLSIRITTAIDKAKGDGQKDVFKILVFNDGDEILASNLSGGQKEIVDSALRMAIGLTLGDTQSKKFLSSYWDESDKSIDTPSAIKYFEMLEKAHQIGNKYFTFVISHRSMSQNRIDQRILMESL